MSGASDPPLRIGHGFDLHRLEPLPPEGRGRPLILAGVPLDHPRGPVGHSDSDAVYHAVTDALLGAVGATDIGQRFPDTDPAYEGADSSAFLADAAREVDRAGYELLNLDVTVICERPAIAPHKQAMTANLARVLGCLPPRVNLKGKTHEQVDAVGEGRAVEVHCVALLQRRAT